MILAPFRKENTFNNLRKDGKFGTDLVNSMINTLRTLELANVSQIYLLPHENINTPSENQILFNDLCARQLRNVFCAAWSVLRMGSTKSVPNSVSFLEL